MGSQPRSTSISNLRFSDADVNDVSALEQFNERAGPVREVDVVATFQLRSLTPNGPDAGFRLIINDGVQRAAVVTCAMLNNQRVLALAGPGASSDPATYLASTIVDWLGGTVRLRLRRAADGGAELVEVNGVAPNPRVFLLPDQVASRTRAGATFEIGCFSPEVLVDVDVTEFYAEMPSTQITGALDFTDFRIRDTDSIDRLRFRADFALGAGSDGIDPSTELVSVKLSTPTYGQFYPARAADFSPLSGFDVRGRTPRRRWSLNDAEWTRSGIERLDFDENPNRTGAMVLRDLGTSLPAIDYSSVTVMVDSGFDLFTQTIPLVEKRAGSGQGRLPR